MIYIRAIENTAYNALDAFDVYLVVLGIVILILYLWKIASSKREYDIVNGKWKVKHDKDEGYIDLLEHLKNEHPEAYRVYKEIEKENE